MDGGLGPLLLLALLVAVTCVVGPLLLVTFVVVVSFGTAWVSTAINDRAERSNGRASEVDPEDAW